MNFRELIIPAALTFITLYIINTFFPTYKDDTRADGQGVVVQEDPHLRGPINTQIDFDDATIDGEYQEQVVSTQRGTYTFVNESGSIAALTFTHPADVQADIQTLMVPENGQEQYAFITALDTQTPLYYELTNKEERDVAVQLTYQGESDRARITKVYTIYTATHQIDLDLTLEPFVEAGCTPRIFLPAPYISDIAEYDTIQMITYSHDKLAKHAVKDIHDTIWLRPQLFGVEDNYCIHTLVNDTNQFVQRAYAKTGGPEKATAVYEGPHVQQTTTWHLSFYCGPKEARLFNEVDTRLEATLEYGWLAPISKFMLWILQWLYTYVGNYGWAIILLTVAMRLLLLPFAARGEAQVKPQSSEFARKKKLLEEKYKNDQETLAREQYNLAREYGVLPNVTGCLPLLLQIPVFIGLNYALRNSVLLYKAPFIGWIHNLSAPDPYYVLPVLVGVSMFTHAMTMQQRQQQMTLGVLSVAIIGFMAQMSSGLVLYIVASTLLAVLQTSISKKWKTA